MVAVLVVGLLMNAIALPLAARRVLFLYRVISSGQPAPDRIKGVTRRIGAAIKRQMVEVFGQKKMLKWTVPGTAHFFVMWAFFILATVYLEAYGSLVKLLIHGGSLENGQHLSWAIPLVGHWALLGFLQDFIAVMALFGLVTFYVIRLRNTPKSLGRKSRFFGSHLGPAYLTLFMIFNVIWTMFLFRGAGAALGSLPYKSGAFASIGVGKLLDGLGHGTLEALEGIGLLLHIGVMLVFLIFVLNSKHLHIFLAPLNVLFGRQPVALGAAKPMTSAGKALTLDDLEDLDEDAKLGVGAAEDFSWKGVLDMATCTECGRCQSQCPAWNTEKPLSPKLLMMALRDHTMAKAPYLLADEDKREGLVEGNEKLAREVERPLVGDTGDEWFYMPEDGSGVIDPDVLWSCVTCGACVQQCPVDIEHVDHIVDMRRYQVLVESNFPAELNGLFKGLEGKGNPWNMSSTARLDWAKDLPFEVKVVGEDVESLDEVEWLFWVGCAGAYEDRAKKTTRAVAELLDMAGVSFAVLGNGETCNGDSARRAGNEFVFQGLAAQNIETFKEYKVKKAVTTCAHCFNTLKNEYRQLGIALEVVHHTQLLNRLVREKKLTPIRTPERSWKGPHQRPITYHDPCYLGRHNQVYEAPRELLNVLPDTQFVEMPRNSERSFCCGAGGARMWMEENIGTRINETRTMEAVNTGAEQIAVGCPFCRVMLSDGLTAAQSKGEAREEVAVLDVAQMLLAAVKGESKPAKADGKKQGTKKAAASDAKAGDGAASGGTATATIEREDTDAEATKAEPDAEDTTQTEDTVTDTEDVGPAAKASGGSSLFDLGDDSPDDASDDASDEQDSSEAGAKADDEAKAEPAEEKPESSDEGLGGGSLFDVGDDSSDEPKKKPAAEPKPEDTGEAVDRSQDDADTDVEPEEGDSQDTSDADAKAETEAGDEADAGDEQEPASATSGSASTPGTEIPEGGSLFDIAAPAEEEVSRPAPADDETTDAEDSAVSADEDSTDSTETEDAAADSTTDGDIDRSQDDADTDVEPDQDESEDAAESESGPKAEPAPAAASSGTASTPGTEIPEGGSLFDIEAPAEEEVSRPAPADDETTEAAATEKVEDSATEEPTETEDAAADSTTDGDIDRSQDDADTDVEPDQDETENAAEVGEDSQADDQADDRSADADEAEGEAEPARAASSSGTASTPGTEIPEGGSLFDIEAPAEEEVSRPAPAADETTDTQDTATDSADQDSTDQDSTDTAETEDAAADSTTDGDIDRSQDDADTDVEPDADDAAEEDGQVDEVEEESTSSDVEGTGTDAAETTSDDSDGSSVTSLRDIKAKFSGDTQADGSGAEPATDEPADQGAEADDEADASGEDAAEEESGESDDAAEEPHTEGAEEEKPKPAASGEAHQPRTDAEIGEGGSLFDL